MAKTLIKLDPKFVDSFVVLRETSRRNCAYRGCVKRVRVKVLWRAKYSDPQNSDGVCFEHAIEISNLVLSVRKFGHRYERSTV